MSSPTQQTTGNRIVFEDSIEVPASISDVYQRWTEFTRFPDFMANVESVQSLGNNRYHWIARILGIKQEWDAEVTEMEPDRRISWRSTDGSFNQGTVKFKSLPTGTTEVRLHMEYAPPGGKTGQALDKVTQATRREVREDLVNFRRLFAGAGATLVWADEIGVPGGPGELLAKVAFPAVALVGGGAAAWYVERQRLAKAPLRRLESQVEPVAAVSGWLFTLLSAGSIIASGTIRTRNDKINSLFTGQWAPTLLGFGILSRLLGDRRTKSTPISTAATFGFAAASAASILSSATIHARGRRTDGLFVGQWAPTFIGAAILSRLIGSLR